MSNFVCLNVDVPADLIPDTYALLNAMEEDGYVNCLPLIVDDERHICTLASVDKCKKLEHCKFVNDDKLYYNFYYFKALISFTREFSSKRELKREMSRVEKLMSTQYNSIFYTEDDITHIHYDYLQWKIEKECSDIYGSIYMDDEDDE